MKTPLRLDVTPAITAALEAVDRAERRYHPGADSYSLIEIPKLDLADAVIEAIQATRLDQLPKRGRMIRFKSSRPPLRRRGA